MKLSTLVPVVLTASTATVTAHSIFQKLSVNGVDQGQLKGVRAPDSDYPIQNVNDAAFACNKDIRHKDNNVITVPAGAKVGAWWGHVIGGAQGPNDSDHPIARSHKGVYLGFLVLVLGVWCSWWRDEGTACQ
jgi:cellulase